jgi:hypothetical protein
MRGAIERDCEVGEGIGGEGIGDWRAMRDGWKCQGLCDGGGMEEKESLVGGEERGGEERGRSVNF